MPQFCPTSSQLERLALASPFAYQLYTANPVRFNDFLSQFPLDIVLPDIAHIVHAHTNSCVCEQALMAALRQLRQCLMVRWIWQDALGLIAVMRLTYELSAFAESCLVVAQAFMYDKLVARVGAPFFRQGATLVADEFAIIVMGKLGAGELNLSSDIDLVFVHRADGRTVPTKTGKSWDNHKFMLAMGRGIIKLLHEVSADGFVFRIDMRLRPWGEGSALVITLWALTQYLTKHGRTWERFAWLKARVVNDVSADFLSALQSTRKNFVFRYYVDYSAFSALREMLSLIHI